MTVETPAGREFFGVLVAPAGALWRARILTYPRTLWTIPGGSVAMKFVSSRPRDAERQAVEFIERFCNAQGYRREDGAASAEAAAVDPERAPEARGAIASSARKPFVAAVRFGPDLPSRVAITADVSDRGLCVRTSEPLQAGAALRLRLSLRAFSVPLRGVVVWSRGTPQTGRLTGMGIRIIHPPSLYADFVARL